MEPLLFWALETLFLNDFAPQPNSAPLFQNLLATKTAMTGNSSASAPSQASSPNTPIEKSIQLAAQQTGLSPALLKAVATVESSLNPLAVSSAGAVGVMQLMPQTAESLHVDPYNAGQNVLGGAEYLKSLLDTFQGDLPLALAAYNAGPGAVQHFGGIPPYRQTQNYVQKVLSQYQTLCSSTPEVT
jgi:soluble lytic murein transglycosylase-like protein